MATNLTKNGISTTTSLDTFAYEEFGLGGELKVQWDYRDKMGDLHVGYAKDLESAKVAARFFGYESELCPYSECSGCRKGANSGSTHFEGSFQHPLGRI